VRLLNATLSIAGRSIFILGTLVCSMHICEGLASHSLRPTTGGMQLKTQQAKIVVEYKTKIPANLQSPSAAYFDLVNTPSGERVSNAAPDDHPWHRGIFPGILNSEFRIPVDISKLPPDHVEGAFSVKRTYFWPGVSMPQVLTAPSKTATCGSSTQTRSRQNSGSATTGW
jgi:hypothetical protein